jgi:hypothetical protein
MVPGSERAVVLARSCGLYAIVVASDGRTVLTK